MELRESTFIRYAMNHYDNPHCTSVDEFEEDIKRFMYVRKLFNKYESLGDLNERLILNHLIILFNCFGQAATNMLFFQMQEYHSYLKPFIVLLNYMPDAIHYENKTIISKNVESDIRISVRLEKIAKA